MPANSKLKVAVFCSGFGSNLQALINASKKGQTKSAISLVITDKADSYSLVRANREKIDAAFINPGDFKTKAAYEKALIAILKKYKIRLVALAGYMRILSPTFINAFNGKIMNVHPALLPAFKGAHGIQDAFEHGVKLTGVTIHFVTADLDNGPIILQEAIPVRQSDTEVTLASNIHKTEHALYARAIKLFAEGKLRVKGRKVLIKS